MYGYADYDGHPIPVSGSSMEWSTVHSLPDDKAGIIVSRDYLPQSGDRLTAETFERFAIGETE